MSGQIRLDKCLAKLGLGSRSEVREIIKKGCVLIGGETVRDPAFKFDAETCAIQVDGKEYGYKSSRTLMMNKPAGILTAARDSRQQTVMDLLPPMYKAMDCMPAGRLDKDTTGLLILTSDGDLAHRLISPGKEIVKVYEALLDGPLEPRDFMALRQGIEVKDEDGAFTAKPAEVQQALDAGENAYRIGVTEGRYHQVKRMFAMCGRTVLQLRRLRIGALSLDPDLPPGGFRELSNAEIELLLRQESAFAET